jgi:Tol biopolymer transport system component
MPELKEVFDMVSQKVEPELDAWNQQEQRQRRMARNRRIGAAAVAAAVVAGVVVAAIVSGGPLRKDNTGTDRGPTLPTEPPLGPAVVALNGTVRARIPNIPRGAEGLEMSPDGDTIAFITDGRVAVIGVDGRGFRILTDALNNSFGDAHEAVAWSPDGTEMAYVANDDIYVMNTDGSNPRRLTTAGNGDYFPVWSAENVIAYWNGATTGEDAGPMDSEIYTIPAEGGSPTRLTDDEVNDIEPTWSPNGDRIAYWHGGELFVMNADGSDARRLYTGEGGAWAPAWSPDGGRIAFLSFDPSERSVNDRPLLEVFVLDLATEEVTHLGMRVESDLNGPSWTPDGDLLINQHD